MMDNHDDLPDLLEDKISRLQEINADLLAACRAALEFVSNYREEATRGRITGAVLEHLCDLRDQLSSAIRKPTE